MNKVYVITRGEYSNYGIETIFMNREAAEKYCAVYPNRYGDEPMIEEWDITDGSEIDCQHVYKAIFFSMGEHGSLYYADMKYSTKPFVLDICKNRHGDYGVVHGISGYIPVTKTIINRDEKKKIIFDHVAKWKSEQANL